MSNMAKKNNKKKTTSCGTVTYRNLSKNHHISDVEILLIKQFSNRNIWGIPKGHVDPGETLEQCAIRETREEAGILTELGIRLDSVKIQNKKEDKTVIPFLATQICDHDPSPCDPDSEVSDARWFKINSLPEIHTYQKSVIAQALIILVSNWIQLQND